MNVRRDRVWDRTYVRSNVRMWTYDPYESNLWIRVCTFYTVHTHMRTRGPRPCRERELSDAGNLCTRGLGSLDRSRIGNGVSRFFSDPKYKRLVYEIPCEILRGRVQDRTQSGCGCRCRTQYNTCFQFCVRTHTIRFCTHLTECLSQIFVCCNLWCKSSVYIHSVFRLNIIQF
jgi:hypothetical protein